MMIFEIHPGGLASGLPAGQHVSIADGRTGTQLPVDPLRILRRPWRGDLELVGTAMTVPAIEAVPVDLVLGQLIKTVEQAEAGQLPGSGAEAGGQCVCGGVSGQSLQPPASRDERGATGPGCC